LALDPLLDLLAVAEDSQTQQPQQQQQQQQQQQRTAAACCFSLVGLHSSSGFSAGLLLAHQCEQSRLEELELLGPHLGMLGTLMTLMVGSFPLKHTV